MFTMNCDDSFLELIANRELNRRLGENNQRTQIAAFMAQHIDLRPSCKFQWCVTVLCYILLIKLRNPSLVESDVEMSEKGALESWEDTQTTAMKQ